MLLEVAHGTISPLLTDETCDPVIGGRMTELAVYRLCRAGSLVNTCQCLSRYTRAWTCRPRAVVDRQRLSLRSSLQRARKLHGYRQRGRGSRTLKENRLPYDDYAE